MEIEKKVQENNKIASGFCALRDKSGNWICHTISMDQNKNYSRSQDLAFHPCEKIRNDISANKDNLLMPYFENGRANHVLDTSKVRIEGLMQNQSNEATTAMNLGREHFFNK
ncbi:MAG: hypothetical protein MJ054_00180 [Clostridia bacterium]|nr:hypothetical protein [Clostridia bacterium]